MPDLVVVDGGAGQLRAAGDALAGLGIAGQPLIALAKRLEEIYRTGAERPILLPRHSHALHILQAIRDEAHRFALTYNRQLRRRRLTESELDDIPGVGGIRRNRLLLEFGSVARLAQASPEEIASRVPGIGAELAGQVADCLRRRRNGKKV